MNIIKKTDFRKVRDVRLNRGGKIIGQIVIYRREFYYLSHRNKNTYFIKFGGFGMDRELIKKMVIPSSKDGDITFQKIEGIIIFYDGTREKRYYVASPYDFWEKGIPYGTAKQVGDVESYGSQYILSKKYMKILGYSTDDTEVLKRREAVNKWKKWGI